MKILACRRTVIALANGITQVADASNASYLLVDYLISFLFDL